MLICPMPGLLVKLHVAPGETVQPGQPLATVEAMKMETRVEAPRSGRLRHLAEAGKPIGFGAPLARIEPA